MTQTRAGDAPAAAPPSGLRRVVAASMAGTVVEWYDFFLYATAATLVFGTVFFPPSDDPFAPIIAALLTYAVGFVARPLGGVVFGDLGDKFGRKSMLQFSDHPHRRGRSSWGAFRRMRSARRPGHPCC